MEQDYVVLDIETTGLEAGKHRIIEIGAVKIKGQQQVGTFSRLIRPYRRMGFDYLPKEITDLTGITFEMIQGGGHIEEILLELRDFIGNSTLLGHNLKRFDMGFLQSDYAYFFDSPLENQLIDSLDLARKVFNKKHGNSLPKLAQKFGVLGKGPAHRALNDCLITHEVYLKLCQLQGESI